jgi:hypothetical protein
VKKQDTAVLVAVGIGLAIAAPVYVTLALVSGRSVLGQELMMLFVHAALIAMPFLILAGKMFYDKLTWVAGVVLIVPAWALFLYAGVRYQLSGDTSGVGGEAAVVLVWPFLVSFACVRLAHWRAR